MNPGKVPKIRKPINLEGILIPTSWDERGQPTGFSIFTFDEREYKLDCGHGVGNEISTFIRKKVRVTYRYNKDNGTKEYIIVDNIYELNKSDS